MLDALHSQCAEADWADRQTVVFFGGPSFVLPPFSRSRRTHILQTSRLFVLLFSVRLFPLFVLSEELILMGLHPADIISGYTKAYRKTLELIESPDLVFDKIEGKEIENKDRLARAILAPMAAKQYGYESFLAPL